MHNPVAMTLPSLSRMSLFVVLALAACSHSQTTAPATPAVGGLTVASRDANLRAAALNCRHLGGTGGIPTLLEVTQAAGISAQ